MQIHHLAGTPTAMGQAFGESCRTQIHALYAARLAVAQEQALKYGGQTVGEPEVLEIARRCLPFVRKFSPNGVQELEGIAAGANLSLEQVWAMNGLTDLRDVAAYHDAAIWAAPPDGEGCSSFVLPASKTAAGRSLCGQTWDLSTDNMPFVCLVHREPENGPKTTCLTTVGCLSLIGMNEHGISVGTTNLRTTDARVGVCYLDCIHEALAQTNLQDAARVIEDAPRAGAHYFYLLDGEGKGVTLECSATRAVRKDVAGEVAVHCNHILEEGNKSCEAQGTPMESSMHRQSRMGELLGEKPSVDDVMRALADHHGGARSVCRHDFAGISSNGSVVMDPVRRRFFAVHGPACQGSWVELEASTATPPPLPLDPEDIATTKSLLRSLDRRGDSVSDRKAYDEAVISSRTKKGALLVTDLSGFTRLTQKHGVLHFLALFRRCELLCRPLLGQFRGRLLKHEADDLIGIFDNASDAVGCAVAMQRATQLANLQLDKDDRVHLCVGVESGSIIRLDDDAYGDAVNLAYKLGEDIANKGEVLVGETAWADINRDGFDFSGLTIDGPRSVETGKVDIIHHALMLGGLES